MLLECTLMINSPSGMQFESFKEVSVYLLSLLGEKNLDKPTHTPSNNRDDFGSKGASMNVSWYLQLVSFFFFPLFFVFLGPFSFPSVSLYIYIINFSQLLLLTFFLFNYP